MFMSKLDFVLIWICLGLFSILFTATLVSVGLNELGYPEFFLLMKKIILFRFWK